MLRTSYDVDADAIYLHLSSGKVDHTDTLDAGTLVDVDAAGLPVGIEVLHPARRWPLDEVLARYRVSASDSALLRALFPFPSFASPQPVRFPATDHEMAGTGGESVPVA